MSLMDFLPLTDDEIVKGLRALANIVRDDAYKEGSYERAYEAHVLFSALERLRDNGIPSPVDPKRRLELN